MNKNAFFRQAFRIAFIVLTVINYLLFRNNRLLTSSVWSFVLYCVMIVMASCIAACTFFLPIKKKETEPE